MNPRAIVCGLLNKRNEKIELSTGLESGWGGSFCTVEINLVIVNTVPGNATRT